MTSVWKYRIAIEDGWQEIPSKQGATLLFAALDPRGQPCVWCLVDTDAPDGDVQVCVVGTGRAVPPNARHVGSFMELPFVWHVFTPGR